MADYPSHRFFSSYRARSAAVFCLSAYVAAVFISVLVAHVFLVLRPQSGLGERVLSPVANGLAFLDSHWKSVLILVAPFLMPVMQDLVPRLRKIGGVEFDSIDMQNVMLQKKPRE
jgi:hypothetical protein